jgi:hypothetical protein
MEWIVAAGFVGWLLTALGWLVANGQANRRESRKEYRGAVDALETDVDRLLEAYREYLTELKAVENEQARLRVHAEINRLRRHVISLATDVGPELVRAYEDLFEAITGGVFESRVRQPAKAAEDYARSVTAAEALLDCSDTWFRKKYIIPTLSDRLVRQFRKVFPRSPDNQPRL